MLDPWDDSELAHRFRAQADTAMPRAPLNAALCRIIGSRRELYGLLRHAPPEQRQPVLLLAALHAAVLARPGTELAAWYPNLHPAPLPPDDRRLPGAVGSFVAGHEAEIVDTVATRTTQTNEVGRCALFLPVFAQVATEVGPLAHLDVGASAGLNLHLDRYAYRYEPGGNVGGASPVTITCGTRGALPVPLRMPAIAARRGIDAAPIDLSHELEARWLEACVWPDQADRFVRLRAAITVARAHPVEIVCGDAVELVGAEVERIAEHGHPVVTNSWVLSYLDDARRAEYVAELDRVGARCDLTWVYAESPAQTPGLPAAQDLAGRHLTALTAVTWRSGARTVRHLGIAHPHGYWLHWRG